MNNFKELEFDMDMLDGLDSYDNHESNNINSSIITEELLGIKLILKKEQLNIIKP